LVEQSAVGGNLGLQILIAVLVYQDPRSFGCYYRHPSLTDLLKAGVI